MTHQSEARERSCSVADLRQMWEAASINFGPLLRDMAAARTASGDVPKKAARAIWFKARGPFAAAALALDTVGWSFNGPFELRDERGATYLLTMSSPAMIRDLMKDAFRRTVERRIAARWARADARFAGRRACLDLAISGSRPGKRFTPMQTGAFKAAVCGALMTGDRARRLGYATDGLCPLCRLAPDTLRHRVYGCSVAEPTVRAAVPRWFWEESQRAPADDMFWLTAAFPHPADIVPPPCRERFVQVQVFPEAEAACPSAVAYASERGFANAEEREARTANQKLELGGLLYVDGSCTPSPIRDMARAACSLIEVSEEGDKIRTIEATVPWNLPQTAQCAENLAMAMGFDHVRRRAVFTGDCLNVIHAMNGTSRRALTPTSKYAGLVPSTHKHPERRRLVESVRRTKAHRTAIHNETTSEARDILANGHADQLAKDAVKLHPPMGPDVEAMISYYTRRAPHVITAIVAALECFPLLQRSPAPASTCRRFPGQRTTSTLVAVPRRDVAMRHLPRLDQHAQPTRVPPSPTVPRPLC